MAGYQAPSREGNVELRDKRQVKGGITEHNYNGPCPSQPSLTNLSIVHSNFPAGTNLGTKVI